MGSQPSKARAMNILGEYDVMNNQGSLHVSIEKKKIDGEIVMLAKVSSGGCCEQMSERELTEEHSDMEKVGAIVTKKLQKMAKELG